MTATTKKNFTVETILGISVIIRTRKAKGCNLKACKFSEKELHCMAFQANIRNFQGIFQITLQFEFSSGATGRR